MADLASLDEIVTPGSALSFDAYSTLIIFELGPTILKVSEDRLELDNLPTRDLGLKRRVWISRYGHPGSVPASSRRRPRGSPPERSRRS
ncbi:hypothetical protein ACFPH6_06665 [Streptomyces xiangluensis]|uniref:Uncharacterized protein n=1 Tax=Streptomyces xiangluensis TaxID=2665720 RepID=A0ABV8YI81_9ACTN